MSGSMPHIVASVVIPLREISSRRVLQALTATEAKRVSPMAIANITRKEKMSTGMQEKGDRHTLLCSV